MPTMLKNVEITDEVEAINKSVKQLKKTKALNLSLFLRITEVQQMGTA